VPKYELWCRILSRIELDQRSREARLQLEQIEWLLIPPASGKKRFFEGGRGGGGTSQTGRVRRLLAKGRASASAWRRLSWRLRAAASRRAKARTHSRCVTLA